MTETLAHGYSSESTRQELSNELQHDKVWIVSKRFCNIGLSTKVASESEGLKYNVYKEYNIYSQKVCIECYLGIREDVTHLVM